MEEKNAIYKKRKLSQNKVRRYNNLKINKNIYLNGLNYNEEMGALSKDDIIYVLIETKNAINQINRTLQTNFDTKIKSKLEKYLIKMNGTYLTKLKKTVSMSALKFSKFLTKDTYKILESKMLNHYYILENYIFNFSNYLMNYTYDLIESIKSSSDYLQDINDFTYDKILGMHDLFINLIENKYSRISYEELESYNKYIQKRRLKKKNNITDFDYTLRDDFIDLFKEMKEENYKIVGDIFGVSFQVKLKIFDKVKYNFIKAGKEKIDGDDEDEEEYDLNLGITLTLKNFKFKEFGIGLNIEKCYTILELKIPITIYLISFPYLQFRIVPSIDINACVQIGLEANIEKNDYEMNLILDCYLNAIASVSLEIGLYYPPFSTGFEMSFSIGIKGILGSGKVGVKDFSNLFNPNKSKTIEYYEYQAIQVYFYILFKIDINYKFFQFSFQFYLLKENIYSSCTKCAGKGQREKK